MTIGEVARRSGISASTLRFYEAEGLLPEPERVSGRRRYDTSFLKRLAAIQIAKRAGFTLAEIGTLLSGFSDETPPSERWRRLAGRKLPQIEEMIARAQEMRRVLEDGLACGCVRLEDCSLVELDRVEEPAGAPTLTSDMPMHTSTRRGTS